MQSKSFDQFVCLAGMPRAGSTVLAAILSQNPQIHTEGNSPMLLEPTVRAQRAQQLTMVCTEGAYHGLVPVLPGEPPKVAYPGSTTKIPIVEDDGDLQE